MRIKLPAGKGKIKMEVPSRSVSSMKPFVFFSYDVTAQMFFEQAEFSRMSAEQDANDAANGGGGSGDELGDEDLGVRKEDED